MPMAANDVDLKHDASSIAKERYNLECHNRSGDICDGDNAHDANTETSNKSRWSYVKDFILSGVTPLGPQRWPVVFTWIVLALVLVVFSGELLYSKETLGQIYKRFALSALYVD